MQIYVITVSLCYETGLEITLQPWIQIRTDQIGGENTTKCRFFSMILQSLATDKRWIRTRKFLILRIVLRIRIRDPVPFDLWIRNPGLVKNQDPVPGSGSGKNKPDHIRELRNSFFGLKY